jgi:hypothetical protein
MRKTNNLSVGFGGGKKSTRARMIAFYIVGLNMTENENDELFKNSIQEYVQYLEELKQKKKKLAMKIISHAWRSYKSKLVKIWRNQDTHFNTYKDLSEEDQVRFVEKCES